MLPTIIISAITFATITLSIVLFPSIRIKGYKIGTYWIISLVGAIILLATSLAPINEVWAQLTSDNAVNPIKILILFFSMTIISVFLDEFGLFKYLAVLASKKAKSSQFALFFIFFAIISLLTIFTSNDIVILTFTPFICFFCKRAKINPLPYLVSEFVAANTWSTMLIIGNPTNIYLATSAGINFVEYFKVMAIPTLVAGVVQIALIILIFHKKLKKPLEPQEDPFTIQSKVDFLNYFKVMAIPTLLGSIVELAILFLLFFRKLKEPISISDEEYKIESEIDIFIGLIHLLICLVFLVISSYINIQMWLVALISCCSLFIFVLLNRIITKKNWKYLGETFLRLPYQLIPFFLSMFVIVVAINQQGIAAKLGEILMHGPTIFVYGYSSFFACNLINNIPMSILFANLPNGLPYNEYIRAIYSTIIGSNIGAFLTPIGALAGIMFSGLVNKYEVKFTFMDFIKYGSIIAIPVITVELASLYLFI